MQTSVEKCRSVPKTSWGKADEESKIKYKESVSAKLNSLQVHHLNHCRNLHCSEHTEDIFNYTVDVLEAVEAAARESLPVVGGGGSGGHYPSKVPGWKEHVQPYYEESKFWHSLWVSAGKPAEGQLLHLMRDSKHQYKYALRRVQRARHKIQNDMFLTSIMHGGVNIFEEIKKYRGKVKNCSSTIDGEIGAPNIAEHFAGKYKQLYNQNQLGEQITDLKHRLNRKISCQDMVEVNRITESVIRQGLKLMKGNKGDAIFDFQSDCLIEGPPEVVTHLTNLIRLFILHGQVPDIILVCTLLPLVKDNLGDLTQSENYRAIAAGCQVLKLLDIVILILEGEKLSCDQLQFGFQPRASTTMCSWMVTSVIDQYTREGSVVYGCAMDLSKAFDMVEWLALFKVLENRNVSPVFLRTLLYVYTHQSCNVRWNGSLSDTLNVSNGVCQGAVSSPILFSIYIDYLFSIFRGLGFGCRLNSKFYGCFGYADDLLLLSASRSGLQSMINNCSNFMQLQKLKFSTSKNPAKSKTKCIIFSRKARDTVGIVPVKLNGDDLPWVPELKYLGNILECSNSMTRDIAVKRGKFIGKVNSLSQEFHYASPDVFMKMLNIYAVSFHGSSLWDIFSKECDRVYAAWNVAVRQAWSLPNRTHRYLIETISGCLHPKVMLASRCFAFSQSLLRSTKYNVRILARLCMLDNRTRLGRTVNRISQECGCEVNELSPGLIKANMKYFPIPSHEEWRTGLLSELLSCSLDLPGFTEEETNAMVSFLCIS